jgi:hypothetical protein
LWRDSGNFAERAQLRHVGEAALTDSTAQSECVLGVRVVQRIQRVDLNKGWRRLAP